MLDDLVTAEIERLMRQLTRGMRARAVSAKSQSNNAHLRSLAIEIGDLPHGCEYWIVENPISRHVRDLRKEENGLPHGFMEQHAWLFEDMGRLNGYVAFPKRHTPVRERSKGILAYIPVHGGITYSRKDQTAAVYGFDTAHIGSGAMPTGERPWIAWQCRVMHQGLLAASKMQDEYYRAPLHRRAEIAAELSALVPEETPGFQAMVNVLFGEL